MTDDIRRKLEEPFPRAAIKQRKGDGQSGRMLDYIEGHTVIRRLNEATNSHWDFHVTAIDSTEIGADRNGNPRLLWKVRGAVTIPGMGTRENIGVQVASLGTGEDLLKGAITDCIKRCATLFGVGLELYGPDYEDAEPVDRSTGEIVAKAPQRAAGNADRVLGPAPDAERARVAKSLADLAKRRGVNLVILGKYAVEKVGKPLEDCDAGTLGKLITALQNETDIPGLVDFFANPPGGEQGRFLPEPEPALAGPDRFTR